jgi:cell wall-associated NlpC family hydrolase
VDCSGFARWVLANAGVELPDGSFNQIKVCSRLPEAQQADPPALSLGFFQAPGAAAVDHVVISMGHGVVIEARGAPYNCVLLRPVSAWNAQKGFLGFYAPPKPKEAAC